MSLSEYDFSGSNKAIWFGDVHNNVTFTSVQSKSMDYVFQTDINVRGGEGSNWFLVGYSKRQNEAVNSIINDSILRYLDISALELDSLHKRLGEIQNYDEKDGIWARIIEAKGDSKNIGLALYESYFNEDKYYIDFILKYNHIRNKFEAFNDIDHASQI
ncbi:autotransporter outer membrane beta-barrel domain-containing protein [Campylobacter iguaniorum]|uniref:autotransporter outer membrane beta-barrel domain-containing protein n=1 Tax=Campylobacter iguaniorum TaxID=1244531 RepID=UPI0007C906D7|nr:autotransporter outer membrane beta-barrel domain-containing protein [Campylobacter iguaniorum]